MENVLPLLGVHQQNFENDCRDDDDDDDDDDDLR